MNSKTAGILMATLMVARGTSFIFSKTLMGEFSPLNVLTVRFLMTFIILCILFNEKIRKCNMASLKAGIILGVLYTAVMTLEMYGLRLLDTGVCSFLENTAIIIVPWYELILYKKLPKKITVFCSLIAIAGIGFLSISEGFSLNIGVILAISTALVYASCILATAILAKDGDPITMGIIQMGVMGVLTLIFAFFTGGVSLMHTPSQWTMMLMLVLVCSCFGFAMQPLAQKYISADTAALFSAINPMSTCVIGIIFAGEIYNISKAVGCILIMISILIYVRLGQEM